MTGPRISGRNQNSGYYEPELTFASGSGYSGSSSENQNQNWNSYIFVNLNSYTFLCKQEYVVQFFLWPIAHWQFWISYNKLQLWKGELNSE